jgi:PPOX class probable F420-dependent enzyme
LTTVTKSGQPVPRLVRFYFDWSDVVVYTSPAAAKVGHVSRHGLVSLNLDTDGTGIGIVVVEGLATIDAPERQCASSADGDWPARLRGIEVSTTHDQTE